MTLHRYWPAGAPCPRQVLILVELLRFDLDTEKISMTTVHDDNDSSNGNDSKNEKISMTPAHDGNNPSNGNESTNEKISMTTAHDGNTSSNGNKSVNEKISTTPAHDGNDSWTKLEQQMRQDLGKFYVPCHRKHTSNRSSSCRQPCKTNIV